MRTPAWRALALGFVLLSGAVSGTSVTTPWRVELEGDEYLAVFDADARLRIPLRFEILPPRIVTWEASPANPDVWVLTYDSEGAGTQERFRETRKVVVHVGSRKVLGDFLFEAKSLKEGPAPLRSEWTWEKGGLKIEDAAFGGSRSITF